MPVDAASSISAVPGAAPAADRDVVATLLRRLDRPLVLVGMMGVGKTSLGRRLGALLGVPFVDADEEIEAAAQMTIPEIFATYDEAYFRAGERRVIARLMGDTGSARLMGDTESDAAGAHRQAGPHTKVIATGGGAFCHAETRELILRHGIAIWLDAELDTLVDRTARKANRPLLENGNRREILARLKAERECLYAQAPIHVQSGNVPHQRVIGQVCNAILAWLDAQPPEPTAEQPPEPTDKT